MIHQILRCSRRLAVCMITNWLLLAPAHAVTFQILEVVDQQSVQLSASEQPPLGGWILFSFLDGSASVLEIREVRSAAVVIAEPVSLSKSSLLTVGAIGKLIRLAQENEVMTAHTELMFKDHRGLGNRISDKLVSSRYKPSVYQGITQGETAATLEQGEYMASVYGKVMYGLSSRWLVSTLVTAYLADVYNLEAKYKVWSSDTTFFSLGLGYAKFGRTEENYLNLNLFWDSFSNSKMVSHTYISVALASWKKALDISAVKGAGTSSIHSGYEFLMSNWDRVLIGPSYNFEKKAVGGFLNYVWVWDRLHIMAGLSTNDISKLRIAPEDGYLPGFELYWRF